MDLQSENVSQKFSFVKISYLSFLPKTRNRKIFYYYYIIEDKLLIPRYYSQKMLIKVIDCAT